MSTHLKQDLDPLLICRHIFSVENFVGVIRVGAHHGCEEHHAHAVMPQQVRQVHGPNTAGAQ